MIFFFGPSLLEDRKLVDRILGFPVSSFCWEYLQQKSWRNSRPLPSRFPIFDFFSVSRIVYFGEPQPENCRDVPV